MKVPNLPTDNLYKFFALGGATLFLASIFLPWSKHKEFFSQIYKLEAEQGSFAIDAERISNDLKVLGIKAQEYLREPTDTNKLDELKSELKSLENVSYQQQKRRSDLVAQYNFNSRLLSELQFLDQLALLGQIFGATIMIYGFHFWQTRVQVHQDKILKGSRPDNLIRF